MLEGSTTITALAEKLMGIVRLPIASLLLDVRNPRLEGAKDQNEALEQMLADQDDKLYELADDIVNEGMSPIDRLLVIKSESPSKKYIVLEGNRRLAALRILTNPEALTGLTVKDSLRKRFELLAKKFTKASIEPIDASAVTLAPGLFSVSLSFGVVVNPVDPGPGGMLINAPYGLGFHLSSYRPGL